MNIGQVGLNFNDSNFNNQIMVNFKRVDKNAVEIFSNLIYWSMQFNDCNFKIKLLQFKCLEVKWLDVNQPLYWSTIAWEAYTSFLFLFMNNIPGKT